MTATEASRAFKRVLDGAERGETVVVTRGGKRIATIGPAPRGNGDAVNALLAKGPPDPDWASDITSVRSMLTDDFTTWPDD